MNLGIVSNNMAEWLGLYYGSKIVQMNNLKKIN